MTMAEPTADEGPMLLTITKAAERLGCSRSYIYRLHVRGDLELVKLGNATRVTERSLRNLLNRLQRVVIKRKSKGEQQ